jgi:hypothetical protein
MERIKRRHIRWDRVLESFFLTAIFLFVVWVVVSYCNIVLHNNETNPMYFTWNFFTVLF